MAFELDDLLKDDKKDVNQISDLSKATCTSEEEFKRLLEHCPEFKIKSEKVKKEDAKVRDKEFSWKASKKEVKIRDREWMYGNPIPPDMRALNLNELQQVAIDWRMLTQIRPKLRQDEEIFSRLVQMGKLEAKTRMKERRSYVSPIRRSKNRAGVMESSVKICGECGEEYCDGESCGDVLYDSYIRVAVKTRQTKIKISADTEAIVAKMVPPKKRTKKKIVMREGRTRKKEAKLLLRRHKTGKSGGMRKEESSRGKRLRFVEDNLTTLENHTSSSKQFRRKCSKYRKRGQMQVGRLTSTKKRFS